MSSPETDATITSAEVSANFAFNAVHHKAILADQPAVVSAGPGGLLEMHTRLELYRQVVDCARGLARFGVRAGSRIMAAVPSGAPALVLHLAAASLGAVWVGLPVNGDQDTILHAAHGRSGAVVVVTDLLAGVGQGMSVVSELAVALDRMAIPAVMLPLADPDAYAPNTRDWGELFAVRGDGRFAPVANADPLWESAGEPRRGQSHREALRDNTAILAKRFGVRKDSVLTCPVAAADFAWEVLISGLCLGATLYLADPDTGQPPSRRRLYRFGKLAHAPFTALPPDIAVALDGAERT